MAELKIKADSGGGTVSFKGPATTTSNAAVQLTLPVDDGTSGQYLKTDGSGALSWATVSSVGGATGVGFNDSVKLEFGTDDDTYMMHNGSHQYNRCSTGFYHIQAERTRINNADGSETIATFNQNGNVELYYDNVKAAYTGATGLHVEGSDKRLTFHDDTDTYIQSPAANTIAFHCAGEAMRVDGDGALCIGRTDKQSGSTNLSVQGVNVHPVEVKRAGTGNQGMIGFYNDNGQVGSINTNGSATEYATSSDYRMKENVTALTGAATRLKTLKPYRFNFKSDASKTVDGFIAHEVSTAVPEAISGEKDAVVTQAKIDLGIYKQSQLNDPVYQGIDQSKLVPLLVAALQEALTRIEALEAG